MSPNVREIFTKTAVLPPEERETYLADACGSDAELRLEVQRLLVDAERADSFLGCAEDETVREDDFEECCSEQEGDLVGPYTLRQQIGEGGFGVVWMAEQSEPLSRMVALKVVKAGMDTKQVLARFEAERQALAMMDHPNIAKVLDAGTTPAGRPYFAMELVKGIPITEFCDKQKFGPRHRLELFKDVCAAVSHAHQKGIIHRDLKPSNVMVTLAADVPLVKVIDFGIAKATHSKLTEKTLFTRFEQFLGTPVYMSPEQAAMSAIDVDTRSDIYSLGVLLYELLAGAPPFDQKSLLSAGFDEMRRIIAEDEPPKPSTRLRSTTTGQAATTQTRANAVLETATGSQPKKFHVSANALKGDLDLIVMKAIEKDRTRRYETANAFAADIGRYLADEPVQAAAPSAAYKFRKFVRRNKAAFGAAAAMLVLLLAGIAATSWQALRATAEQKLAEEERDRANQAGELAEQRLEESEQAREEAEGISTFLTRMFESTRPGGEMGGREVKVADVLDLASERLETELVDQPERRAKLQQTLAATYYALGLAKQAIPLQEEVLVLSRKVLGPEHPETLVAMINLASFYANTGRLDEALQMREEVLVLSRKANGPEHPDTLWAMNALASSYDRADRRDEALEMAEEALALSRKVLGPEDPDTLQTMGNLAGSYHAAGRWDEALQIREELFELYRKMRGQEHPNTLDAMNDLAISYSTAGRRDEALEMCEDVLALSRKVLGPEHPDTLGAMGNLTISYSVVGRRDEAIEMGEDWLALSRKVLGPEHPGTAGAAANLGFAYDADGGQAAKAIEVWQEAVRIDPKMELVQYWLGKALFDRKHYREALPALQAARRLNYGPSQEENLQRLKETLIALGRESEAAALPGVAAVPPLPEPVAVLVAADSEWKWLHPTSGGDPAGSAPDFHTTFFTAPFDDANWQSGKDSNEAGGGFGYGDDWFEGVDIGEPASKELGKSAYLRHRFTTATEHRNLELRCQRDDGIIVYLDGVEVARNNMAEGEEAYELPAVRAIADDEERTSVRIPLALEVLPSGEHLLAISLHNTASPSSDLRIGGITLVEVEEIGAKGMLDRP